MTNPQPGRPRSTQPDISPETGAYRVSGTLSLEWRPYRERDFVRGFRRHKQMVRATEGTEPPTKVSGRLSNQPGRVPDLRDNSPISPAGLTLVGWVGGWSSPTWLGQEGYRGRPPPPITRVRNGVIGSLPRNRLGPIHQWLLLSCPMLLADPEISGGWQVYARPLD